MKIKFIYLLPLLLILAAGCLKTGTDPDYNPGNYAYPLGTFTGKFTRIHKTEATLKYDTTTAMLKLVLSTSTGFAVTGDTTMVHAGSYGSFSENANSIIFNDVTYPTMGTPKKAHLAGIYAYAYDGLNLQINGTNADSLIFKYTLVKN
jgi:hypothetical protein